MKKSALIMFASLLVFFTACRVTKTLTMMNAKQRATIPEVAFLAGKHAAVDFLKLSADQEASAESVWKAEKKGFSEGKLENEKIAPVIYKSEIDFRKILTAEQLERYKAVVNEDDPRTIKFFLNDQQMSEIKRIYLKN